MTSKTKADTNLEKKFMNQAMKGNVKPGSIKVVLKKEPKDPRSISKKRPQVEMFISKWSTNDKVSHTVAKQYQYSQSPVRK